MLKTVSISRRDRCFEVKCLYTCVSVRVLQCPFPLNRKRVFMKVSWLPSNSERWYNSSFASLRPIVLHLIEAPSLPHARVQRFGHSHHLKNLAFKEVWHISSRVKLFLIFSIQKFKDHIYTYPQFRHLPPFIYRENLAQIWSWNAWTLMAGRCSMILNRYFQENKS